MTNKCLMWRAVLILLGLWAAIAIVIATAPWSFLVLIIALLLSVIYDGLLHNDFVNKTNKGDRCEKK